MPILFPPLSLRPTIELCCCPAAFYSPPLPFCAFRSLKKFDGCPGSERERERESPVIKVSLLIRTLASTTTILSLLILLLPPPPPLPPTMHSEYLFRYFRIHTRSDERPAPADAYILYCLFFGCCPARERERDGQLTAFGTGFGSYLYKPLAGLINESRLNTAHNNPKRRPEKKRKQNYIYIYKYQKTRLSLSGLFFFRRSCEARRKRMEKKNEEGNHSLSTCGFLFHRLRPLVKIPALSISTQLRINELPRISCGLLCFAIILWLDNRADPLASLRLSLSQPGPIVCAKASLSSRPKQCQRFGSVE